MKHIISIVLILLVFGGALNAITKTALKPEELMKEITDDVSLNYANYTIIEAFKVNNNGKISYEIRIKHQDSEYFLYFNEKGSFLKKEVPMAKGAVKGKDARARMIPVK